MIVNFTMLVRNRFNLTQQALKSLAESGALPNLNLTIFDDNCDEQTRNFLEEWCAHYHAFHVINDVEEGTGRNRNVVIKISRLHHGQGSFLYLSDNDVFFRPGWLRALVSAYWTSWNYGFKVVGAYNHPYHQPIEGAEGLALTNDTLDVLPVHALALQSMIMRWEVWDKYGPFCKTEPGRVCQSEDVDFTNKIIADGGKIGVVSPALIVNTGITNSFGEKIPGWELVKAQCPPGVLCE